MTRRVLGIDVASRAWSAVGSATIEFEESSARFIRVTPSAISWPRAELTAVTLADAIDTYVRRHGVCAVGLDGPQGWRHPDTPAGTAGVGRRCEYLSRTQGKTGVWPMTYPRTQRQWIEFSVATFDHLLEKAGVELADAADWKPCSAYGILECFPTSAWRSSGLKPLPAKSKRPVLDPYIASLRAAYRLPHFATVSHDDLQAVVAALAAVGAARGPCLAIPRGQPSAVVATDGASRRVEGWIWDVKPLGGAAAI